jgi:nitrogen regulatory protein P-II 1
VSYVSSGSGVPRAQTDTIGDGKIWVTTVDSVLRVRTGDQDHAAV